MTNSSRLQRYLGCALVVGVNCAFFAGVGDGIREPKWWALSIFGALVLLSRPRQLGRELWASGGNYPLLIFLLGTLTHGLLTARLLGAAIFTGGFLYFWLVAKLIYLWAKREDPRVLTRLGAFLTLSNALFSLLQVLQVDPIFGLKNQLFASYPAGLLGHHTILGAWTAMMAGWHLGRHEWKLFTVSVLITFSTRSAFAVAALVAVMAVGWLIHSPRRRWIALGLGLAALAVAVKVIFFSEEEGFFFNSGRFLVWQQTVDAILANPWLGYGLFSFAENFHRYQQGFMDPPFLQAHNEVLQWAYETGIFGLAILSPLVAKIVGDVWRSVGNSRRHSALFVLVALTVNSFGNFPLRIAPLAFGFLLALHGIGSVSDERQAIS